MDKLTRNIVSVSLLTLLTVGCNKTTESMSISNADRVQNSTIISESIETPEYKAGILLKKVLLADPIYIETQDREFLNESFLTLNEDSNVSEIECATNTTLSNYRQNIYNILLGYTREYPDEAINLWLDNLDFLAQVNAKIINDPEVVDFDINNLSASSALSVMTSSESLKLQSIILDPRFSKLLVLVGLPTLDKNSELISMFDVSTLYIYTLMLDASEKCNESSLSDG